LENEVHQPSKSSTAPVTEDFAGNSKSSNNPQHGRRGSPERRQVDNMLHTPESLFAKDSLMTPSVQTPNRTAPSPAPGLISSDSPWKALLKMDEEEDEGEEDKLEISRRTNSHPWNRDMVIHRTCSLDEVLPDVSGNKCICSSSNFSSNNDMIEFMLPLMGMACTCGKKSTGLQNPEEPTSLENILREWQVDFLNAFGIFRGDQLVKAHHRSASGLVSALKRYRKKHGMTPFRSQSCTMALSIWAKTSKAFVRSIRKQLMTGLSGELKVPNTLYILSSFLENIPRGDTAEPLNESHGHINDSLLHEEANDAFKFPDDLTEL
jgi:hypothetical protein